MKLAVCVESRPSAAALGATALALSIAQAEVHWVHAGPQVFQPQAVPAGVTNIATVVAPALADAHSQSLALALATVVKRLGCDTVFCGVLSNGAGTGVVGAALAMHLNVPFVAQAHGVRLQNNQLHVSVHGASQIATVAMPWPCVIACVPAAAPLSLQPQIPCQQTFTLAELGIAKEAIRRSSESKIQSVPWPITKTVKGPQMLLHALLQGSSREL